MNIFKNLDLYVDEAGPISPDYSEYKSFLPLPLIKSQLKKCIIEIFSKEKEDVLGWFPITFKFQSDETFDIQLSWELYTPHQKFKFDKIIEGLELSFNLNPDLVYFLCPMRCQFIEQKYYRSAYLNKVVTPALKICERYFFILFTSLKLIDAQLRGLTPSQFLSTFRSWRPR